MNFNIKKLKTLGSTLNWWNWILYFVKLVFHMRWTRYVLHMKISNPPNIKCSACLARIVSVLTIWFQFPTLTTWCYIVFCTLKRYDAQISTNNYKLSRITTYIITYVDSGLGPDCPDFNRFTELCLNLFFEHNLSVFSRHFQSFHWYDLSFSEWISSSLYKLWTKCFFSFSRKTELEFWNWKNLTLLFSSCLLLTELPADVQGRTKGQILAEDRPLVRCSAIQFSNMNQLFTKW